MSIHFIPEDLLRHLWSLHYLNTETLSTLDGQRVNVIDCGMLNRESGPDFHNAVIEIDGIRYRGDVEFHRSIEDWEAHRHEKNPRYNRVILHVVLNKPSDTARHTTQSESGRMIPVLVLAGALSMPIDRMGDALARDEFRSQTGAIPCFRMNDACAPQVLEALIERCASERLAMKTERFFRRLCELRNESERFIAAEPAAPEYDAARRETTSPGDADEIPLPGDAATSANISALRDEALWQQLLYEAVMDCLGYAKNREPMCALAREASISRMKQIAEVTGEIHPFEIQAMLFVLSGLLPEVGDVDDQQSKVIVHQLRTAWSSLQDLLRAHSSEHLLALVPHHKAEWTFAPTRPSNFPTVRLASAATLAGRILSEHFLRRMLSIVGGKYLPPETKRLQMHHAFDPGPDFFWSFHYSFTEAVTRPHALLGDARTDDIIVNAVIPILYLYGRIYERADLCEHTLALAREMPPLEENGILRKMERQLLSGRVVLRTAYAQQGVIQLYREHCTPGRCSECDVTRVM